MIATHALNLIDTKDSDSFEEDRHQIHKRNLNRDFPVGRDAGSVSVYRTSGRTDLEKRRFKRNGISSRNEFDRIVLEDTGLFDNGEGNIPNDTTKYLLRSYPIGVGDELDKRVTNEGSESPSDTDVDTAVIDYIDGLNDVDDSFEDSPVKRDTNAEATNQTTNTNRTTIKDEIDKLYKDITDNVRLLSKLRDKESHLSKRPSKKRWIVCDNSDRNKRKKRCSQELTVEMDTNKEATPDRLEHIERKIDEEVLQVNVPLKCSH